MIKFYFGSEKYLVFHKFLAAKASFKENNFNAQIGEFDFDKIVDLKLVREALVSGGGLFSSEKMIVLKNVGSLDSARQDDLVELLKSKEVSEGTELEVLIVLLNKGKLSIKLKGFLTRKSKRNIESVEFKVLKDGELKKWLKAELKKKTKGDVGIDKDAFEELILITNGDLWRISNELEKLICFSEEKEISVADVRKICSGDIEAGVFDLVDAIGSKNLEKAMTLKNRLIAQGDNEFFIFSMIISQIRNILKVSDCVAKGVRNPDQIAKLSKTHPYVVKKTLMQLKNFPKEKLCFIYRLAAEIDSEAKKGERDMKEAIDYFIAKI